jgi:UDP:flavonoid glycosyltransferase YjiC (YdhE family)
LSHVLFATFGSAGDVLPSIAVAQALQDQGHPTTIMTTRSAGLYARAAGQATVTVGDGTELRVLADQDVYTTRFDGFDSWRRTSASYLHPLLSQGYDGVRRLIERLAPDVVAVHPLAPFASLAATELGVPWAGLHLYPQLSPADRGRRPGRWGGPLATWLHETEARLEIEPWSHPLLRWGWGEVNLSVHDPSLVAATSLATMAVGEPCGFPYWDGVAMAGADGDAVGRALEPGEPLVVATLGSFIGRNRVGFWRQLRAALARRSLPALLLGVPPDLRTELDGSGIHCAGFVPLSAVIGHARFLVHHGGIGTMYAGLQAGVPAIVVPQAFDQAFNGRLLESAGCGRSVRSAEALDQALDEFGGARADRTRPLAAAMVPPAEAARRIGARLVELTG